MAETRVRVEHPPVVLHTHPVLEMDEEQFFEFCQLNRDWRIERSAEGDLEVTAPTEGETSDRNSEINMQVRQWAKRDGAGVAFDSNGAMRSPDDAWVRRERLTILAAEQKQRFLPLCPDFVIGLRSPSDPLAVIEAKMREYVENGAKLGWLIDPEERKAHVYKLGEPVGILSSPHKLCGDPVLSGFTLDLKLIWEPGF